jgi:hypothetical protein
MDWRQITDERERYAAYLCSREWNELKKAVHERAGGRCERCKLFPIDAVHHRNYERKYAELLDDLEGYCKHCHAFTHAKAEFDPLAEDFGMRCYFKVCREKNLIPPPIQIHLENFRIKPYWAILFCGIQQLRSLETLAGYPVDLDDAAELLNRRLPFDLMFWSLWKREQWDADRYQFIRAKLGYPSWRGADLAENPADPEARGS